MAFFSVIICNYNYGRYVAHAIESVLDQTYGDFELIVVDDGSTDESREVIGAFDDPRVKAIFKINGGQASAFNEGFAQSRGGWLAFLDSDDWWIPTRLERLNEYLQLIGDGYAIVQHFLDEWDDGAVRRYRSLRPSGDVWDDMIRTGQLDYFVPTSALNFSRACADKIFPVPAAFWYSADAFMMRTAVAYGKLFTIPEVLGYRRVHERSFTNNILKDRRRVLQMLIPELNAYYEKNGLPMRYDLKRLLPSRTRILASAARRRLLRWQEARGASTS
jgi:glycosyltransferase involved in cell wall biosynthesis